MYTGFAEVYDRLMDDVNYESWANYYCRLMAEYGVRGGKLCECACGTGGLTIPLYKHGFHVTGVDMSQEMLWIAAQKARGQGIAIPFVRQDMRSLRLHRPMDAVLATCDGVNYLLTDEDASAFFQSAFAALRPGGALLFDVSTPYKLRHDLGNEMICEDREDVTYLWQNRFSEKTQVVEMRLCIFVRQEDGSYRRIDEEQKQRAYDVGTLSRLLYAAGFARVLVYGNGTFEAPKEKEHRWHFVALKAQEEAGAEEDIQ